MPADEDTKDGKTKRPATRTAAVGQSAAVYGFNDDDVENQAAYAAWGGRSAWRRGLERAQLFTNPEVEARADNDRDDGNLDLGSGVDGIETHMSVFTFLKLVSESCK